MNPLEILRAPGEASGGTRTVPADPVVLALSAVLCAARQPPLAGELAALDSTLSMFRAHRRVAPESGPGIVPTLSSAPHARRAGHCRRRGALADCDRDRGVSMVEILCAIVLLGLAAAGTLGAMGASVRGSAEQRDLTNAQSWLQSAGDFLQGQQREDCDNVNGVAGEAQTRILGKYQGYIRTVSNAEGWPATNISVVAPVLYWDGDQYQSVCHDNDQINLQLVTIKVVSPDGKITRSLQVVKGA